MTTSVRGATSEPTPAPSEPAKRRQELLPETYILRAQSNEPACETSDRDKRNSRRTRRRGGLENESNRTSITPPKTYISCFFFPWKNSEERGKRSSLFHKQTARLGCRHAAAAATGAGRSWCHWLLSTFSACELLPNNHQQAPSSRGEWAANDKNFASRRVFQKPACFQRLRFEQVFLSR